MAIPLILYNLARGFMTYYVSGLRDTEARGGWSPKWTEFRWPYWIHVYFMKWVPFAAIVAGSFQIAEWLMTTHVVLPAV